VSIFIQFFSDERRNFPQDFSISKRGTFRPFKVIQGQKCLMRQIGTCPLGTRWYNF